MTRATFRVIETPSGTFRWQLRTDGGAVIATSDGTHDSRHAAMRDVQRVKRVAADAGVASGGAGVGGGSESDADADVEKRE
jgi:uncharacterized protein YegP (UPF0339 family)